MGVSVSKFLHDLRATAILPEAEQSQIEASSSTVQRDADAGALAQQLVRDGQLSKFQAHLIYQGKAAGLRLGHYIVVDRIGEGRLGPVFTASDRRVQRTVAIRVLAKSAFSSPDGVNRFLREGRAAAELMHPNIATVHDVEEANGVLFLAMEHVLGCDLSTWVKTRGAMNPRLATECVLQAARGLAHAHGLGFVHRKVRPSNLLLDKSNTVKVLDFGLAPPGDWAPNRSDSAASARTSDSSSTQAVDFSAPELAQPDQPADARCDIYSLGCTLYFLIAGRAPFHGQTPTQRLAARQQAAVPLLSGANPAVWPELEQVYQKMMAQNPTQRYASMTEVIAVLEQCLAAAKAIPATVSGASRIAQPQAAPIPPPTATLLPTPEASRVASGAAPTANDRALSRRGGSKTRLAAFVGIGGMIAAMAVVYVVARPPGDRTTEEAVVQAPSASYVAAAAPPDKPATSGSGAAPVASAVPATPSTESKPTSLADVIERIDDGVVLITIYDQHGDELGLGSGFVIDETGLVATNYHVIQRADKATVRFRDGSTFDVAGARACRPEADLAILTLAGQPDRIEVLQLATDELLRQGAEVVAIGHPRGFDFSVTTGIISAVRRTDELPNEIKGFLESPPDQQWIQTSAAISGGNSGGPLLTPDGRVVGINTWVADGENLGFAAHVRHLLELKQAMTGETKLLSEYSRAERAKQAAKHAPDLAPKLTEVRAELERAQWALSTAGDYARWKKLAELLSLARMLDLETEQIEAVQSALAERTWQFDAHVRALNAHAAAQPLQARQGVAFFGVFVRRHPRGDRVLQLELASSQTNYWVVDSAHGDDSAWSEGDQVLVLGVSDGRRAPAEDESNQAYPVLQAGLALRVDWGPVPADLATTDASGRARWRLPDDAAVGKAVKALHEIFQAEYAAAKSPEQLIALAQQLVSQAQQTPDDQAACYAMLREAQRLAADAGNLAELPQLADAISAQFEVDYLRLLADGWEMMLKRSRSLPVNAQVAESALAALNDAVVSQQFDAAKRLGDIATAAVKKSGNATLSRTIAERVKEVAQIHQQWLAAEEAAAVLALNPDDPAANLALGRFRAFIQGEWEMAFELLAKGDDAALAELARLSIAAASDAGQMAAVGDRWFDAAGQAIGDAKRDFQRGAAYWYAQAIQGLSGLDRLRVEKRLNEMGALATTVHDVATSAAASVSHDQPSAVKVGQPLDLLSLIQVKRDKVSGPWEKREKALAVSPEPHARLRLPISVPSEYKLIVEARHLELPSKEAGGVRIGFVMDGHQCCLNVADGATGISLLDNKPSTDNESATTSALETPATLICEVHRRSVTLTVNGQTVLQWRGDPARLSNESAWDVGDGYALYLGASQACEFTRVDFVPLVHMAAPPPRSAPPSSVVANTSPAKPTNAALTPAKGRVHPADAIAGGGHFYKVIVEKTSWTDAKARCEAMGGRLACVTSREENEFLAQIIKAAIGIPVDDGPGYKCWLGAYLENGEWKWLSGEPFAFTPHTLPINPNNPYLRHSEDRWVARGNITELIAGFVCEWDK